MQIALGSPNRIRLALSALIGLTLVGPHCPAQDAPEKTNRYEKDIVAFETRDKAKPPPENAVLFVGSSSIRMWRTLEQDFPGIAVINRGFGGAEFSDVIHFTDRIVFPYKPRMIIVYAGSLDLHGQGGSPKKVLEMFQAFQKKVHEKLPETRVCFLSMKPSLAKWMTIELDREANRLVSEYAAKTPNVGFIDIWTPMLAEGSPPPATLFLPDRNHLNAEGYKIWTKTIRAYLEEVGLKSQKPEGQ